MSDLNRFRSRSWLVRELHGKPERRLGSRSCNAGGGTATDHGSDPSGLWARGGSENPPTPGQVRARGLRLQEQRRWGRRDERPGARAPRCSLCRRWLWPE